MHRLLGKPKKSKSKLLTGDALEAKRGKFEMLLLQCIHLPKQIAKISELLSHNLYEVFDELCNSEEKLHYHAGSLDTCSQDLLFPLEKITAPTSHILTQLIGLNAKKALDILFSSERMQFPELIDSQGIGALHVLIFQLLATYDHKVNEQSAKHTQLWDILETIRGEEGTAVRKHFESAMAHQDLYKDIQRESLRTFQLKTDTITVENVENLKIFFEKIFKLLPEMGNSLAFVEGLKLIGSPPSNALKSLTPAKHAIYVLYANIIEVHKEKSTAKETAYQWLLEKVRGKEGSEERKNFEALWNDTAYGQLLMKLFQDTLPQDFEIMLTQDKIDMHFWQTLLATLPTTAPGATMLLASVFAQKKVTLNKGKDTEKTYNSWAEVLCEQQQYDWDKIDIKLLSQLVRWGAVIGSTKTREIIGSLITQIAEGVNKEPYLVILAELLAALEGRIAETEVVCGFLYKTPVLTEIFTFALEQQNHLAVIALLQTDYFKDLRELLHAFVLEDPSRAIRLLEAFTDHAQLCEQFIQLLLERETWPQVRQLIIDKLSVNVVLPLQRGKLSNELIEGLVVAMLHKDPTVLNRLYLLVDNNEKQNSSSRRQSRLVDDKNYRERLGSAAEQYCHQNAAAAAAAAATSSGGYVIFDPHSGALNNAIFEQNWAQVVNQLTKLTTNVNLAAVHSLLVTNGYHNSDYKDAIDTAFTRAQLQQQLRLTIQSAHNSLKKGQTLNTEEPSVAAGFDEEQYTPVGDGTSTINFAGLYDPPHDEAANPEPVILRQHRGRSSLFTTTAAAEEHITEEIYGDPGSGTDEPPVAGAASDSICTPALYATVGPREPRESDTDRDPLTDGDPLSNNRDSMYFN